MKKIIMNNKCRKNFGANLNYYEKFNKEGLLQDSYIFIREIKVDLLINIIKYSIIK